MKAKLYTQNDQFEVRVSNKVYSSNEKESKKDFTTRVAGLLETDFDEAIDIVEVKRAQLEKLDDAMLTEAYKASKGGLQEEILKEILTARGIEVTKIEKVVRQKIEKRDLEEVKKSEEYLAAKANVGRLAQYTPTNQKLEEGQEPEVVKGVVKSISLNKTNTIIYYNIQEGTKLRCCTAKNETIEFFDF